MKTEQMIITLSTVLFPILTHSRVLVRIVAIVLTRLFPFLYSNKIMCVSIFVQNTMRVNPNNPIVTNDPL